MERHWQAVVLGAALALAAAAPAAEIPQGFAFELTGERVEGDYSIRCMVSADSWRGDTQMRLVYDVQDDGALHYLAIGSAGLSIGRIRSERYIEMANEPTVRLPKRFELIIHRRGETIAVLVDGQKVLSEEAVIDVGGGLGLGVTGAVTVEDLIMQPVGEVRFVDDFTRGEGETATWEIVEGQWQNTALAAEGFLADFSANAFSVRATGAARALMRTGNWFWESYTVGCSVRPTTAKVVGVAAHVRGGNDMVLFRWVQGGPEETNARQILLARDGKYEALAAVSGGFQPDQWYRLALRVDGNRVSAFVDGFECLSAETDQLTHGPVGVLASDGEAYFDDVIVGPPDELADPGAVLPTQISADPLMRQMGVTNPMVLWQGPANGAFWHMGLFPQDVHIELPMERIGAAPAMVCLRARGPDPASGYQIGLSWSNNYLSFDVRRAGAPVEQFGAPCPADAVVEVDLDGGRLATQVDGDRVYEWTDPEPLYAGSDLGVGLPNGQVLQETVVTSEHHSDCTFTSAPTEWTATKGEWGTDVRWPCDRRWAFFGGRESENPCIWSKRRYEGDVVVEAFGAIRMDIPHCPGYTHPSDICITLCGDGQNLGSGYSFIFAGFNNTKSVIMKGDQIVSQHGGIVFEQPVNTNLAFQRAWFRLVAEKRGNIIRFFVNGQQVGEYQDPEPLSGGQAALWSYRNGPIFARVRTWWADAQPGTLYGLPAPLPERPDPYRWAEGTLVDFEENSGEWHATEDSGTRVFSDPESAATGKRSLSVVNTVSGGPFAAYGNIEPFNVADWPELSFDYAIPAGVKVNLYLYARGAWHTAVLTGGPPTDASVKLIGQFADVVADGQWHSAKLDLQAALRALYPDGRVRVASLALAAPQNANDYLRCGIGGNLKGSWYRIDNFRLGTPQASAGQ